MTQTYPYPYPCRTGKSVVVNMSENDDKPLSRRGKMEERMEIRSSEIPRDGDLDSIILAGMDCEIGAGVRMEYAGWIRVAIVLERGHVMMRGFD